MKSNYADIDKTIDEKIKVAKADLEASLKAYVEQLVSGAGAGEGEGEGDSAAADGSLQAQIDELANILYDYLFGAEAESGVKLKAGEEAAEKASAISKLKDAISKATGATTSETTLSSITLIPDLYINGIEALQFKALTYLPRAFDKTVENQGDNYKRSLIGVSGASEKNVDNGGTTAYYRLSPITVKENDIIKDGVKFYGKTAKTETRGLAEDAGLKENNPIKPLSVKIENGVMAVKMQKTVTGSLRFKGEGNPATLVSLMVPRADGSADIYSEFSLIDETNFKVHIAAENREAGR